MNKADQKQVLKNHAINNIREIYKDNSTFSYEGFDAGLSISECREQEVENIMWQLEYDLNNVKGD